MRLSSNKVCSDAKTRGESLSPSAKSSRQDSPELAAERALHAALHHVDAPKQQGDGASEVENAQSPKHRLAHPCPEGRLPASDSLKPIGVSN